MFDDNEGISYHSAYLGLSTVVKCSHLQVRPVGPDAMYLWRSRGELRRVVRPSRVGHSLLNPSSPRPRDPYQGATAGDARVNCVRTQPHTHDIYPSLPDRNSLALYATAAAKVLSMGKKVILITGAGGFLGVRVSVIFIIYFSRTCYVTY